MLEISGQTIGKYRILERVGHGGMSAIYKALDTSTDTTVALKVLSAAMASDPTFEARFSREIEVLRTLDHPHILPILDYGDIAGLAYIVMPFYQHGTLQDRMSAGLGLDEGIRIFEQVSRALDYAHSQGITHRDVKPTNILLGEDGNAVLSDFGFAHMSDCSLSLTGSALIGTPAYMSPEQCRGEEICGASDQYSLAIVAFEMVTGKPPFQADTPMALVFKHLNDPIPNLCDINPRIPDEVEDVILKALSKDPNRRYASVAAFNKAFQVAVAPTKSSLSKVALRWQRLRIRFNRFRRRFDLFSNQVTRSPAFLPRLRVGLAVAVSVAIPMAVWAVGSLGPGARGANAAANMIDPTSIAATIIAGFEADNAGGEGMSADEMSTAIAATVASLNESLVGGAAATDIPSTPTATPSPSPTLTSTPQPYVPPTATSYVPPPTATPGQQTMHVGDLSGSCAQLGSDWKLTVTAWIVGADGANVSGATVSGAWSVAGPSAKASCLTESNGRCDVESGKISAAGSAFAVTSVSHPFYTYAPSKNVEWQIYVACP
jgi:serine/threonine-protein kinase